MYKQVLKGVDLGLLRTHSPKCIMWYGHDVPSVSNYDIEWIDLAPVIERTEVIEEMEKVTHDVSAGIQLELVNYEEYFKK